MSRSTSRINIGITQGEPKGISPYIVAESIKRLGSDPTVRLKIISGKKTASTIKKLINKKNNNVDFLEPDKRTVPSNMLKNDALASIYYGAKLAKEGLIDALVTAPVDKSRISKHYKGFTGHTGFLRKILKSNDTLMFMSSPSFKIGIMTEHIALKEVAKKIKEERILSSVKLMHEYMKLYKKRAAIAVLALNPHAGEDGLVGTEERDIIIPSIKKLRKSGINVLGPIPADSAFNSNYDAILAMYHDQGMIAAKMRGFDRLVNITLGLPIIRTSPGHGVAYDIKNPKKASPESMITAIQQAVEMVMLKNLLR